MPLQVDATSPNMGICNTVNYYGYGLIVKSLFFPIVRFCTLKQ